MSKKGVTKRGYSKGISYNEQRILTILSKGINSPTKIAKDLKISRKTVYKHINRLIKQRKYGKKTGVTQGGYTILGYSPSKDCWRYNGVQIYYYLPRGVDKNGWKKYKGRMLALKKVSYDETVLGGQKIPQFYLKNKHYTRFYDNGVMVYAPNFYGKTREEADRKLGLWVFGVGEQLRKLTSVNFVKSNELNIKIVKCELSKLRDGVAKQLRINDKKVFVKVGNKLRIGFDFSHGIDERETFTAEHERQDHSVMENVVRDYISKKTYLPGEAKEIIDGLIKTNMVFAQNIGEYNQNIKLHLETLNEIKKALKRLGK